MNNTAVSLSWNSASCPCASVVVRPPFSLQMVSPFASASAAAAGSSVTLPLIATAQLSFLPGAVVCCCCLCCLCCLCCCRVCFLCCCYVLLLLLLLAGLHCWFALRQSGTGKTAVFSMGILQMLDTSSSDTQALVLSPTRELAEQTQKVHPRWRGWFFLCIVAFFVV